MLGVGNLTPTQLAAHERSRAFRTKIAEMAARLTNLETLTIKPRPVRKPQVEERPQEPPKEPQKEPWFSIVKEIDLVPRDYPSIAKIQKVVCEYFGLEINDLRSACRERRISHPRMIAVYLCRELTPKSFPEIGRRFGGRDHSTALHSHQKIRERVQTDQQLAGSIAILREMLA